MRTRLKILFPIFSIVAFFVVSGLVVNFALRMNTNTALSYYISNGVDATIYGNYYVGSNCFKLMSGESDHVVFNGETEDSRQSLSPESSQIDLSSSDGYVVFEYEFINDSDTKNFNVNLFETPVIDNMKVSYGCSHEKLSDFDQISSSEFKMEPVLAGSGNSIFVYIKIGIDNLANDASYSGTFSFIFYTCDVCELTLENEETESKTLNVVYGEYAAPIEVEAVEGKTFMGYFTERNGEGEQVNDEFGEFCDIWETTGSTTLYAYYI